MPPAAVVGVRRHLGSLLTTIFALSILPAAVSLTYFLTSSLPIWLRLGVSAHGALAAIAFDSIFLVLLASASPVYWIAVFLSVSLYAAAAASFVFSLVRYDGPRLMHLLHVVSGFFAINTLPLFVLLAACSRGGCH